MSMIQRVKELPDVHLQQPAAAQGHRLLPDGFQRLMCRPAWSEAVRAAQKVLLEDRLQRHDDRPLKSLVLQGRHSKGRSVRTGTSRNTNSEYCQCPYVA